jgi:hypothetical protein
VRAFSCDGPGTAAAQGAARQQDNDMTSLIENNEALATIDTKELTPITGGNWKKYYRDYGSGQFLAPQFPRISWGGQLPAIPWNGAANSGE